MLMSVMLMLTPQQDHHSLKNTWFTTVSLILSLYSWGFLTWRLLLRECTNLEYLDLFVSNSSFLTGWSSLVASLTATMTECSAPRVELLFKKHPHVSHCWVGERLKADSWFNCDACERTCLTGVLSDYTLVQMSTTLISEITRFWIYHTHPPFYLTFTL